MVTEKRFEHRDEFSSDRTLHTVSVELCHGTWTTFSRYATCDAVVRRHEGRGEAREYARRFMEAL